MTFSWLALGLLSLWLPSPAAATPYHFDAALGDDAAEGSATRPFRTLARANGLSLQPGDELRFRAGQEFAGNLTLDAADAGTSNLPVVITSFAGGRARIAAGAGTGIFVRNAGGMIVSDLEIYGVAANRNIGAGIRFENSTTNRLSFLRVRNVTCHDFGGLPVITLNPAGKSHHYDFGQGVAVCARRPIHRLNALADTEGSGPGLEPVRGFADVVIEDCEVFGCQGYGIHFDGPDPADGQAFAHADVRVTRCATHDNPGDGDFFNNHSGSGIFLSSVERGLVEHCRAWNNGAECKAYTGGPCGIWAANSTRVVIRRCESFRNRTGRLDGAGFDLDGGVTDSVVELCYAHENDGAGFLFYSYPGAPLRFAGNVCRFSVSRGDNRRGAYGGICVGAHGGRWEGMDIYHNTVVTDATNVAGAALCLVTDARPVNIRVWNNLFVSHGAVPLVRGAGLPGLQIVGNGWWSDETPPRFVQGNEVFLSLDAWRLATGLERLAGRDTGFFENPALTPPAVRVGPASALHRLVAEANSRLAVVPPGLHDFFDQPLAAEGPWLPGADGLVKP